MKAIVIAAIIATGFAAAGSQTASAFGGSHSYAYQYCQYYKIRALGADSAYRADRMWAKYYACLKEYGG